MQSLQEAQQNRKAINAKTTPHDQMNDRAKLNRISTLFKRRHKYSARRTIIDGQVFDSAAEAEFWQLLCLRQKAGEIHNLRRQVAFELAPSVVINGRKRPPLRYIADFAWEENGKTVVADVKGMSTEAYRIKRHLLKAVHGIDIVEIKNGKTTTPVIKNKSASFLRDSSLGKSSKTKKS